MENYSLLREFADSWVLLLMTLFFIGTIAWAFRPGSRAIHEETANIPFRNDEIGQTSTSPCATSCNDLTCQPETTCDAEVAK